MQYRAKTGSWKKKKTNKGKSTFFPDSWGRQRIEAEVHSAYIDAIKSGLNANPLIGRSASGVPITIITRNDGSGSLRVRSAFPIYE